MNCFTLHFHESWAAAALAALAAGEISAGAAAISAGAADSKPIFYPFPTFCFPIFWFRV
jgi:hypothetical protein